MKYSERKTSTNLNYLSVENFEGETIEDKVIRIITTNEPITDGAPLVYTEYKDGVRPEYNLRTDKFELAIEAMDKVHATNIARTKTLLNPETEGEEKTDRNPAPEGAA